MEGTELKNDTWVSILGLLPTRSEMLKTVLYQPGSSFSVTKLKYWLDDILNVLSVFNDPWKEVEET